MEMRFIVDCSGETPARNMAVDEALLLSDSPLTLRLYQWQPHGLSLGFFQPDLPDEELHRWQDAGIPVVRRLTGGGAILHGHELTYSLSGPDNAPPFIGDVSQSYRVVHDAFLTCLKSLGIEAEYARDAPDSLKHSERPFFCFARPTSLDLLLDGKKILGSARRQGKGRILQHGSLILSAHPLGGPSGQIGEVLPDAITTDHLTELLGQAVAAALGTTLCPGVLTDKERNMASALELEQGPRRRRR